MGIQDLIAISIAAGATGYALRCVWRQINAGGCGSGKCSRSDPKNTASLMGVKRKPLVTIDQIGQPDAKAGPSIDR